MSKLRLPKKQLVVDYDYLYRMDLPMDEPFNLIVFKDGVKCDFVVHLKSCTNKLLVLGSGLTPRDKVPKMNPYYNRVSWDFKYSTIFYNDPTSYVHDSIYGAWGVGTKETWYLEVLSDVIKRISENLYNYSENNKYKNIIFIGSSQAGFMSFMLSVLVKNSSSISDIPQTDIFSGFDQNNRLPFHIYKDAILKYLFNNDNLTEIYDEYGYRLSFIELMKKEKYIPNAFLCLDCSFNIDFQNQYLPFFEKFNQLPFKDEFSNTIRVRIDGKNVEHRNMSKETLMETIDNVIFINNCDEEQLSFNRNIRYNIVENTVKTNGVIRFYGFNNINFDELSVSFKDKLIKFSDLEKGFSKTLGVYFDLKASFLGKGIHDICLKYRDKFSKYSKIFVKDEYNILDYNFWSGTDYSANVKGIFTGNGQSVESSDEWKFQGSRSIKITRTGDSGTWTDIPIGNLFEGDVIKVSANVNADTIVSSFLVFVDNDGNQAFSGASLVDSQSRNIYIESIVNKNIKEGYLRFWIKGGIGSNIFVDNLNVIIKKKKVAIYGSCCTKDPFTTLFNKDYKKDYVAVINDQRHSMISILQEKEQINPKLLEIMPKYSGSEFITKCLIDDFNKNFIDLMIDNEIDYLVFDVFFEIDFGILCYDNKIITNARGIADTEFYKLLKNKKFINMIDTPEAFYKLWVEYCDRFFDFLNVNCPNTHVVLVEVRSLYNVLKDDGSVYIDEGFKEIAELYNPLIKKLENYIKEKYDVLILPFDESLFCIENHVWGKHHIHYQDRYYFEFLEKFKKLIEIDSLINSK